MKLRHITLTGLVLFISCGWAQARDMTILEKLPPGVSVRVEADSLDALVAKVRPRCMWNGTDMLWIGHDTKGSLYFTVDRAFGVRAADGTIHAALLRVPADSQVDPAITGEYLRESTSLNRSKDDPNAVGNIKAFRLSRDNDLGTVYEIDWKQRADSGVGSQTQGCSILVLCDAAGKWSLVGVGPGEHSDWGHAEGRASDQTTDYAVRWTGDPATPAVISFTTVQTCYRPDLQDWNNHAVVVIRRDGVLTGAAPAKVKWQGPSYVLTARGATLDAIGQRVAIWGTDYAAGNFDHQHEILHIARAELLRLNPHVPDGALAAGTRVNVPEVDDLSQAIQAANQAADVR